LHGCSAYKNIVTSGVVWKIKFLTEILRMMGAGCEKYASAMPSARPMFQQPISAKSL
jgi:hypothetical protein